MEKKVYTTVLGSPYYKALSFAQNPVAQDIRNQARSLSFPEDEVMRIEISNCLWSQRYLTEKQQQTGEAPMLTGQGLLDLYGEMKSQGYILSTDFPYSIPDTLIAAHPDWVLFPPDSYAVFPQPGRFFIQIGETESGLAVMEASLVPWAFPISHSRLFTS
jgi:hypothetical protein